MLCSGSAIKWLTIRIDTKHTDARHKKYPNRTKKDVKESTPRTNWQSYRSEMRCRSLAASASFFIFLQFQSNCFYEAWKSHQFHFGFGPGLEHVPHVNECDDSRRIFSTIWISFLFNFFLVIRKFSIFTAHLSSCLARRWHLPARKQQMICVGRELVAVVAKKEAERTRKEMKKKNCEENSTAKEI